MMKRFLIGVVLVAMLVPQGVEAQARATATAPTRVIYIRSVDSGPFVFAANVCIQWSATITQCADGMRSGTNTQEFHIYRTYTDGSNYERIEMGGSTSIFGVASSPYIAMRQAGTGTARPLGFGTSNAVLWALATDGSWSPAVDNTYDIGATGNYRPRSLYFATALIGPGTVASTGVLRSANNSGGVAWRNAGNNGNIALTVDASDIYRFDGGSSYPAGFSFVTAASTGLSGSTTAINVTALPLRLVPQASPPGSPLAGMMYTDSTPAADELCFYDGAAWQGISSGTDGNCA